jgi:hypothetical protein
MTEILIEAALAPLGFLAVVMGEVVGDELDRRLGIFAYATGILLCIVVFAAPLRYFVDRPALAAIGVCIFAAGALAGRWWLDRRA